MSTSTSSMSASTSNGSASTLNMSASTSKGSASTSSFEVIDLVDDANSPIYTDSCQIFGGNKRAKSEPVYIDEDSNDADEIIGSSESYDMAGKKCRVAYSLSWGELRDHNAMIINTERSNEEQSSPDMARVVFLNPTHRSMRTCPYFLEDKCSFAEDACRYCHGAVVLLSELKPFKEPDFASVRIGSRCLAKDEEDSIWYPATVVDILTECKYNVQFDITLVLRFVDLHDILPVEDYEEDAVLINSDSEVNDWKGVIRISESEDDDGESSAYQWNTNAINVDFGTWEMHTRGIGSKLMKKMGYILGQGLGKNGEGRSEPVLVVQLPKGKSLDKIMQLKSCTVENGLCKSVKKQKQNKFALKSKLKSLSKAESSSSSVFDFLNSKLGTHENKNHRKNNEKDTVINLSPISFKDLKLKSDKEINIELFKTYEEIDGTNDAIKKLKESLRRTELQDPKAAELIRTKLVSLQEYVKQIETSKSLMQRHVNNKKANKSLTKF